VPLTTTGVIAAAAAGPGRAAAAFNVISLEHAEGLVAGAERAGCAVILQISENCVRYHGDLLPLASACLATARAASVPVAVHLDHAESVDLVDAAIAAGLGSVMYDASRLDYAANVAATREVTATAHVAGVWVEAELGEVGGKDGAHAPGARTDPDEARAFVAATGVDALAVAVGSSHAMATRDAVLDLDLVARLRDAVDVPLVLHGSSGVPDDVLRAAVAAGIVKVNIGTQLNRVFTGGVRAALAARPDVVDPRRYLDAGRAALADETARLLEVIGAVPAAALPA